MSVCLSVCTLACFRNDNVVARGHGSVLLCWQYDKYDKLAFQCSASGFVDGVMFAGHVRKVKSK